MNSISSSYPKKNPLYVAGDKVRRGLEGFLDSLKKWNSYTGLNTDSFGCFREEKVEKLYQRDTEDMAATREII